MVDNDEILSMYEPMPEREKSELSEAEREALAAYEKHKRMKVHLQADFEEAIEQGSFKGLVAGLDIYITYRIRLLYKGLIERGQIPPI